METELRKSEIDLPQTPGIRDLGLKGYHVWLFWMFLCFVVRFFFLPPPIRQALDIQTHQVPFRVIVLHDRFRDLLLIFIGMGLTGFSLSWLKHQRGLDGKNEAGFPS